MTSARPTWILSVTRAHTTTTRRSRRRHSRRSLERFHACLRGHVELLALCCLLIAFVVRRSVQGNLIRNAGRRGHAPVGRPRICSRPAVWSKLHSLCSLTTFSQFVRMICVSAALVIGGGVSLVSDLHTRWESAQLRRPGGGTNHMTTLTRSGRPRWYKPDAGLAARMVLTMFLLGLVYVLFAGVMVKLWYGVIAIPLA